MFVVEEMGTPCGFLSYQCTSIGGGWFTVLYIQEYIQLYFSSSPIPSMLGKIKQGEDYECI